MSSSVQSLIDYGTAGLVVDIECNLSNNLPNIVIVGFVSKAVDEARERVRGAFASSGIDMPRKRITINLAPADIPKASSGFDLAIAAAIILAAKASKSKRPVKRRLAATSVNTAVATNTKPRKPDSERDPSLALELGVPELTRLTEHDPTELQLTKHEAVMGELGLDGAVRPVRGIIGKILAGRRHGLTTFYIPLANLPQARLIPGVTLVPIAKLTELYAYLSEGVEPPHIDTGDGTAPTTEIAMNSVAPESDAQTSRHRRHH